MKKRLTIASLILILALVLTSVFVLLAAAEPTTEATLTIGENTVSGTYDEMVEALNNGIATIGEGTATLTLMADAKATKQVALTGTGVENIAINLGGYTLDISALEGDAFVVAEVASFDLDGDYNTYAKTGKIVGAGNCGVVGLHNVAVSEIYDIAIEYAAAASAISVSGNGDSTLRNVEITSNTASDASFYIIGVDTADLTLINSDIIDATTGNGEIAGIRANGSVVRLENTAIVADIAYSNGGGSELTAVDAKLEGKTAIFGGEPAAEDKIRLLGAQLKGAILGGSTTKDMVEVYYGTGSTVIESAENPSDFFTLATTVATLSELSSGKWTLLENASTEVIWAIAFDRGDVTEKAGKFGDAATASTTVQETKNVVTVAFIADKTYDTKQVSFFGTTSNGKTSTFIDYNGFNIFQTKAAHFQSANGLFRLSLDGADAAGNVGGVTNTAFNGGVLYVNESNIDSVVTFRNIRITNTNGSGRARKTLSSGSVSNSSSNMVQLQSARYYLDNVHGLYTGADYGRGVDLGISADGKVEDAYYYPTTYSAPMFMLQSNAYLTAENCRFESAPTGEIVAKGIGIGNTVFSMSTSSSAVNKAKVFATGCEFIGVGAAGSTGANEHHRMIIASSTVSTVGVPFNGAGTEYHIIVVDCDITLADGKDLASGKVEFLAGEGKTKVHTGGTNVSGTQVLPDGHIFWYSANEEAFIMLGGDAVTTVKLNKLFANGMVFQADKPINVWGTCQTEGAEIVVTLGDKTASATVSGGEWMATLDAMGYAKGLTLTITEVGKSVADTVFTGIDIGEVWFASGQSNSNLGAYKMEDFQEYLDLADNYDNIRCFSVKNALSETPLSDFGTAKWYQVNSKTLPKSFGDDSNTGLSAVAYVMATRLAVELPDNATVAIIDVNYNGKAISNFISNNYDPGAKSADVEHQIYNAMLAPFKGYNVKGIGWYQGEATADSGECDSLTDGKYGLNIDQLYATYTETCNMNEGNAPLELFIVQLSAYMGNPSAIRAYQADIAARNEHYHLVSSSWAGSVLASADFALDAGNGFQYSHVHAARKSPIGLAWADSVLENVYFKDQNLDIANPELESVVAEGGSIKVTLDRDFTLLYGTEVIGFELSNDNQNWYRATGTVDGRTITLTCAELSAPKYVRYAYGYAKIELESGEWLDFTTATGNKYVADTGSTKATLVTITTADGRTIEIHTADSEILRSMLPGNIVATNGHTLAVFNTAYTSSTAGEN